MTQPTSQSPTRSPNSAAEAPYLPLRERRRASREGLRRALQGATADVARKPRDLGTSTALLIGVSAMALAAFAKIGEDVLEEETAPVDQPIRNFALAHQQPALRAVFRVATEVGAPRVLVPAAALVAAWFWRRRQLPIAAAGMMAPAAASALFVAAKHLFQRQRPAGGSELGHVSHSFPSGHATASAAIFGVLGHLLWREELLPRPAALAVATLPPAAIGSSRVYLDVHWATDVLAGWSAGGLVAALSSMVYERVRRNTRLKGEAAAVQGDGAELAS